jgi:hypothetical protein
MTKKDKELLAMMKTFKTLNEKEQGFVLGLAEGFSICKIKTAISDDSHINDLISNYK